MVNSESNLCPTLRPTRQQFERPFRDYVREQFLKHPEWACFKVRSWPTRVPDALSYHDAGFVAARPHVRSSSFAWHRSSLPNAGRQISGASMTWTRSGSQLPSDSMCALGGQSPGVVGASLSYQDWACDRVVAIISHALSECVMCFARRRRITAASPVSGELNHSCSPRHRRLARAERIAAFWRSRGCGGLPSGF